MRPSDQHRLKTVGCSKNRFGVSYHTGLQRSGVTLLGSQSEWPKESHFYWFIPGMLETYTIPKEKEFLKSRDAFWDNLIYPNLST